MKSDFDIVLKNYNSVTSDIVDSSEMYYKAIVDNVPAHIQNIVGNGYLVKGSCGQGNKALNPWVCIFDTRITRTATYGLYIVYLFRSDMTGFYLALSQGITTFERRFGRDRYNVAEKVSAYFQRKITDDYFSKERIDLRSPVGSLGYGYESTTILSKFYPSDAYDDATLHSDLEKMLEIYKNVADNMGDNAYDSVVDNVYYNQKDEFVSSKVAIREIKGTVDKPGEEETVNELTLVDTLEPKKKTYRNLFSRAPRKVDYLKKAERDAKIGLKGEELVLDYERKRLEAAGRSDLLDKIMWVAEDDDSLGYDIQSFDFDDNGDIREIHIEVKTTKSELNNPFFITYNELKALDDDPDNYRIYRVSIKKGVPTVYVIRGTELKERFSLAPYNYLASLEG